MTVRILPGQDTSYVAQVLRELEFEASNLSSARHDAFGKFNAYLLWVSQSVERLAHLVRPSDVQHLLATPRYWSILALDPASHDSAAMHALLRLEIDERHRALAQAHLQLSTAIQEWDRRAGLLVVPDSSVYLHHVDPFDRIDWVGLLDAGAEEVHLLVPLVIIDELDRLKESQRNALVHESSKETVRTRARTTLRTLYRYLGSSDTSARLTAAEGLRAVGLHLVSEEPHHRRLFDADHEVVEVAGELVTLTRRQVTIVTFDTGMALRANTAGVRALKLE